jgi:hypothetical protein
MSTIYFTSQRNSMKRDSSSGTANMAAPTVSAYSGTIYVTNLTVPHNLGYVPLFRYYYEPFRDGIVWVPLTDRLNGRATNPLNVAAFGPGIVGWADSTNLYLQLFYDTNALTGTYPVYYVIYKDFHL